MNPEADPLKPLRDLLAQVPLVDVEALAFDEQHQAERKELEDWAARTLETARALGRHDVVEKVERITAPVNDAEARLQSAVAHRREQTMLAEEALNRLDRN